MTTALIEELSRHDAPRVVSLTVDQFQEMIRAGIVPEGAPIELIDGMLVYKDRGSTGDRLMGHSPRHALIVTRLVHLLIRWCENLGHHVRVQLPIVVNETSAPEPDVAIVVGSPDGYALRHPGPQDVAAVFEVADSSLQYDTTTKRRLFAGAGIPIYWIVNLVDAKVAVNLQPDATSGVYSRTQEFRPGDTIRLAVGQDELEIDVAALLA